MTKADIRDFRRWHRTAVKNAKQAGFDIIYVYAGHNMALTQHFLLPSLNQRTDEYGGSLENRARLLRETLEDTLEEVDGQCAVALRFAVDEMKGDDGMQAAEEGRAVVEMLADLPDLWDVNVSDWPNDSITTRFQPNDGYQTNYIAFVKQVTNKPVVSVGRLSSPDLMVSLIKQGVVDFIGAARPSIADPFLPKKIEENRIEDIRECIGCNICVASDNLGVPIRCTQNPTIGEEWRHDWHPEIIESKGKEEAALVVGAGPAGLECALQLTRRGYHVTLAEASDALGGRVLAESQLKGLGAWQRVVDYRVYQLQQSAHANLYLNSTLDAEQVIALGIPNVFIATGARWRKDTVGRSSRRPLIANDRIKIFTPDDIVKGTLPATGGPIVIYDDDQAYLAGVIADHLAETHDDITFVTPAGVVSPWMDHTLEQERIQRSLLNHGIDIRATRILSAIGDGKVETACVYTGQKQDHACTSLVLVTERLRETTLFDELSSLRESGQASLKTLELIGDAAMPGLIADAVYAGHKAARDFEADPALIEQALFRRETPSLDPL